MMKAFKSFVAGGLVLGSVFLSAAQGAAENSPEQKKNKDDAHSYRLPDMTSHPLAGMEVEIEIMVEDALQQNGRSKVVKINLPQRSYKNPVSPLLADLRRTLALDTRTSGDVTKNLRLLIADNEKKFKNPETRDRLKQVYKNLLESQSTEVLEGVVQDIWSIILQLEEDVLSAAEKKLRDAEKALREAMEDGASEEEI